MVFMFNAHCELRQAHNQGRRDAGGEEMDVRRGKLPAQNC